MIPASQRKEWDRLKELPAGARTLPRTCFLLAEQIMELCPEVPNVHLSFYEDSVDACIGIYLQWDRSKMSVTIDATQIRADLFEVDPDEDYMPLLFEHNEITQCLTHIRKWIS